MSARNLAGGASVIHFRRRETGEESVNIPVEFSAIAGHNPHPSGDSLPSPGFDERCILLSYVQVNLLSPIG
jgi:hypothetical protein